MVKEVQNEKHRLLRSPFGSLGHSTSSSIDGFLKHASSWQRYGALPSSLSLYLSLSSFSLFCSFASLSASSCFPSSCWSSSCFLHSCSCATPSYSLQPSRFFVVLLDATVSPASSASFILHLLFFLLRLTPRLDLSRC